MLLASPTIPPMYVVGLYVIRGNPVHEVLKTRRELGVGILGGIKASQQPTGCRSSSILCIHRVFCYNILLYTPDHGKAVSVTQ